MSEETKRLTMDDPVGTETMTKLQELQDAEIDTAMMLKSLKQQEVQLLATDRRILAERHKIFEVVLMDRGLAPNTPATINADTGKVELVQTPRPEIPQ